MKKYSLYLIGFTAALSGGFAADSQEALHRHYAALASKYAEIAGVDRKQSSSVASAAGDFCADEISNTQEKADLYRQPLDRMIGALDILLRLPIVQQPMAMGMGGMYGFQAPEPKTLTHFLSGKEDPGFTRISFRGNLENQPEVRGAFMELVNYTATHKIVALVGPEVANLEVFLNGAVFPTLCRAANAARAFLLQAAREEVALRAQAKLALMSSMPAPLSAELITAIKIAKQEQGVLSALVQKFDEVVDALKKAGHMS